MARPCWIQINASGSWRNAIRLDLDTAPEHGRSALNAAADLVRACDMTGRTRLRLVVADSLATPLMYWSAAEGWRQVGVH